MSLRVLIANSTFYPQVVGGAEMSTWLLARELSARGVHVDALATTGFLDAGPRDTLASRRLDGIAGEILEAASGGRQHLLARPGEAAPGLVTRGLHHFQQVHDQRWRRLALAALERTRPDVVHTNTIVGMSAAVWEAARARGVPVVHTLRDYHLLCPRTTLQRSSGAQCAGGPLPCQMLRYLKRRHTDGVSLVTAPSRYVLDRHAAFGFFREIRREVVPNACEGEPPAYREPPAGSRRGLFLGQLDHHKGVGVLLAALRSVLADPPPDFGFDFAGRGPLQADVEAFAAGHPDRVRFHGMVQGDAKQALLRDCAFVVVPSVWHDNFPRTLLDAYMHGRPVIGSRRGGIPEVVRDGETGALVEPEPAPLAAAIRRYAADPTLSRAQGLAARVEADRYTLARQADRFLAIYGDLTRGRAQ
ncbi:MAG TPA: glycosyltransferase family 4 protein [Candidatus Krumholzibacteria bacterium]|nr:glycosyltransferase family 4 protein [Candidatus Krumholzibacteria bacterium]HPD70713.1 glycosyltransferase family 4 protein [Candidatus Krumholzibacteria bacterium]HRY39587.1 glycosyltransferase family 4 protein [Candidatus Krumholzibacteria bacterium]